MESEGFEEGSFGVFHCMNRFLGSAISGTLTGLFAIAGAFTGAVTGALAGRASDSGVLRGAGLGALAGAVLCVEVLEASRAYWCVEQSGSRGSSSMADFIEELFRRRFDDQQFSPGMPSSFHWQVDISGMSRYEMHDTYEIDSRGLSGDYLKKLPCYMILDEAKPGKTTYCTICLQDIIRGEMARSLPKCLHAFHLACVDKWLIRHSSCPVCRQDV